MSPSRRSTVRPAPRRGRARGFTLMEVIMALSIMAGSLLAMAMYVRTLTKTTTDTTVRTMANDLVNQRIETIKGWRVYTTLVSTYNGTSETWASPNPYVGFTRTTAAVRTGPNATADYVTVTVTVSGRGLSSPAKTTTIIAAF